MSSAIIGSISRGQWAVLNLKLATGKTVTEILKEKGLYGNLSEDPQQSTVRATSLNVRIRVNPKDVANVYGPNLIEAKIKGPERYYKRNGGDPPSYVLA